MLRAAPRLVLGLVTVGLAELLACKPAESPAPLVVEPCAAGATDRGNGCYDEVAVFLDCADGRKPDGGPCDHPDGGSDPRCNCQPGDLMCAMKCSTR